MVNRYGRAGIVSRFLFGLCLLLLLGGCYDVNQEVIPASRAELIPYAGDTINWTNGEVSRFTRAAFGNEYRFQHTESRGVTTGTFRALHIIGDVYALQMHSDKDLNTWFIRFYEITKNHVQELEPDDEDRVAELAASWHVTLEDQGISVIVKGESRDILEFIRAHATVDFK